MVYNLAITLVLVPTSIQACASSVRVGHGQRERCQPLCRLLRIIGTWDEGRKRPGEDTWALPADNLFESAL